MDIFEENCDTENNCTVSYFWKGLALFLLGVIIGLFVSPIKKGITIGCNNKIDKGGCNDHFDPDEYYDDYNFDDYHQSVELSGVSCQSLDCASSCRDLCGYTGYGIASVCFPRDGN